MTAKLWFIYIAVFVIATFIDQVGHTAISIADPNDINNAITFNVDEEASGSGFLGLPRQSLEFALTTLPKFITWNFGFLSGDFQIVQYILMMIFGGLLMLTWGGSLLGLVQRNR